MTEEMIGKKGVQEWTVTKELLASSMKSGTVNVFATPYMIALMEYTAMTLVQPFLPEGITTVGTAVNVQHLCPTPEGRRSVRKPRFWSPTSGASCSGFPFGTKPD